MKVALLLFTIFCNILFAKFQAIDYSYLDFLQKKGVVVIDIRREEEWIERGIIPGAKTITFFDKKGNYDFIKFMAQLTKYVKDKHQPFIIYCAHANRTKVLGKFLSDMLRLDRVYELKGGIEYGWIDKGQKVIPYKK